MAREARTPRPATRRRAGPLDSRRRHLAVQTAREDALIEAIMPEVVRVWNEEMVRPAIHDALRGSATGVRQALEWVVEAYYAGRLGYSEGSRADWVALETVVPLLERVLAVDMAIPDNRKGDLAKAIGLVSRASEERRKQRAIYRVMRRLHESPDLVTGTGRKARLASVEMCARVVSEAFKRTALHHIEPASVKKIYQRWLEAGPAPIGPALK